MAAVIQLEKLTKSYGAQRGIIDVDLDVEQGATRHPLAVAAVKAVHTSIFLVELTSIGWLVVSGLIGRRDRTVALAAAAVAAEAAVYWGNDRVCPLTPLTVRLGAIKGGVSDIFLPDAVARTIPIWSSALVVLAVLHHARSAVQASRRS